MRPEKRNITTFTTLLVPSLFHIPSPQFHSRIIFKNMTIRLVYIQRVPGPLGYVAKLHPKRAF
jgi:hypothetical protein